MAKHPKLDLKSIKALLEKKFAELTRLSETSKAGRKPVELDQTSVGRLSRMDALQVQAMALETGRRREVELLRAKAALKRIEENEYGWCVNCGEDIDVKRLNLDPTVPNCIDCAE